MFTLESIELDGTVYYCVSRELLWEMQHFVRQNTYFLYNGIAGEWVFYQLGDWEFEYTETCLRVYPPSGSYTCLVFDTLH